MKRLIIIAVFIATLQIVVGDELLPPNDLRAPWSELKALSFAEWKIIAFNGWAIPFDGGSKVFFFDSDKGGRFGVMAANPAYWNEKEKKNRKQVFYVIRKNRFYRLEAESDEEKKLAFMVENARPQFTGTGRENSKLLDRLVEHIRNRKPMFKLK